MTIKGAGHVHLSRGVQPQLADKELNPIPVNSKGERRVRLKIKARGYEAKIIEKTVWSGDRTLRVDMVNNPAVRYAPARTHVVVGFGHCSPPPWRPPGPDTSGQRGAAKASAPTEEAPILAAEDAWNRGEFLEVCLSRCKTYPSLLFHNEPMNKSIQIAYRIAIRVSKRATSRGSWRQTRTGASLERSIRPNLILRPLP